MELKSPRYSSWDGWVTKDVDEDLRLLEIGFIHEQTWHTVIQRNIYKHPAKGVHYFYTYHGDDSIMYFDSIEKAEEIYMKTNRVDYKVDCNTITFPFVYALVKELTNLI